MIKKILFIFVVCALVISCSVNKITMNQIQYISKGISIAECNSFLSPKSPKYGYVIEKEENEYYIQIYDMVVRTEKQYGMNNGNNAPAVASNGVSFFSGFTPPTPPAFNFNNMPPTSYSVDYTEPFAFIFENGKLIYWGLFNELSKCEDEKISNLTPAIQSVYDKLEKQGYLD